MIEPKDINVLIGGEESQEFCIAFRELGFNAYSCDLKKCSGGKPEWHLQDNYNNLLYAGWHLGIFHPECTRVAVCGNGTYGKGKEKYNERLMSARNIENFWFRCTGIFKYLCFENPVSILTTMTRIPKPQYIQPYQFGHLETKKTALFLHNLPKLKETNNVYEEMIKLPDKEKHKIWYMAKSNKRSELRSKTYPGIAKAAATQWGNYLLKELNNG